MKHLLIIVSTIFLFLGCTQKQQVVSVQKSEQKKQKTFVDKFSNDIVSIKTNPIAEDKIIEEVKEVVVQKNAFKLAVVYPSKIVGKYANNTVNTVFGYLLYKNKEFEVETFDTINENMQNIQKEFELLENKGFTKVIALFTENGFKNLQNLQINNDLKIYFPLINKKEEINDSRYIFGGISYKKQIELLNTLSNYQNSMFYQESYIGNKLKEIYENSTNNIKLVKSIKRRENYYKKLVDDERLNNTSLTLNTPIIKTSIILSQLRAFEITPNIVLSTQINYNPLLVSLTQEEDRINFIVANSIDDVDNNLEDILKELDSNVVYDWVNYSSLVGVNYLFDENESNVIKTKIENNKVIYEPKLYNSTAYGFQKIK